MVQGETENREEEKIAQRQLTTKEAIKKNEEKERGGGVEEEEQPGEGREKEVIPEAMALPGRLQNLVLLWLLFFCQVLNSRKVKQRPPPFFPEALVVGNGPLDEVTAVSKEEMSSYLR